MEMSLLELWRATGPLARGVVGLLGGMSVAATAVGVDKWLRLRRAERESERFLTAWRERDVTDDDAVAALAADHPASRIAALIRALAPVASADGDDARRELHDRIVRREAVAANTELRKGLGVLATVGSTAPFVGLFGTVVGIINAFHEIGATGHGGVSTVSTGIAEALITTAFGIAVAIPAVWLFNHLSQRVGRQIAALEQAGEDVAIRRLGAEHAPQHARTTTRAGAPSWR